MKKINLIMILFLSNAPFLNAGETALSKPVNDAESVLPKNGEELVIFLSSPSVSGSSEDSTETREENESFVTSKDSYKSATSNPETYQQKFQNAASGLVKKLPSIPFRKNNTKSLPTNLENAALDEFTKKEPIKSTIYRIKSYEHFLQETNLFNDKVTKELLPAPKTILDHLKTDKQVAREPRLSGWTVGAMVTTPLVVLGGSFFALDKVGSSAKVSAGTLTMIGGLCAFGEYGIYSNATSTVYQTVKNLLEEIPADKLSHIARYAQHTKEHTGTNPFNNSLSFELTKTILAGKSCGICLQRDIPKIITSLDSLKEKLERAQYLCRNKTFEVHQEEADSKINLNDLIKEEIVKIENTKELIKNVTEDTFSFFNKNKPLED